MRETSSTKEIMGSKYKKLLLEYKVLKEAMGLLLLIIFMGTK